MRSLYSILFAFAALTVCGQQTKPDSVKKDSVQYKYVPTGIRVGADLAALIKSNVQNDFTGWEVNADVDFYRYFLAFDYGAWGRTYANDSVNYNGDSVAYRNDGSYWRIGADVNFLTKDPERNMFFIGMRYGRSTFSENMTIRSSDKVWGDFVRDYSNEEVKSRWLELTTGVRVKIWKMIWMGYTARFKFGLKNSDDREMLPHDVPGYGRTDKQTYWGFNYQVFIRIPVRKQPAPLPQQ